MTEFEKGDWVVVDEENGSWVGRVYVDRDNEVPPPWPENIFVLHLGLDSIREVPRENVALWTPAPTDRDELEEWLSDV